ncbi:hybrid sensor histidine kinase/response regulator [Hydrogenophaga sp.]|uniref:hybrid sensor histidine kinase/response regulator n=1 Tax=Hydrogenophaga sp. TaxID=1904254 RepID=UPI00263049AF|nr:hybrid sensor histidine kinase/response regulator [Hydrogenophaga sp.]
MVDDEPQACKWFARLYGNEFAVLTAHDVEQALALLAERSHEVAVLLTDYAMPQRNGVDLLAQVRQRYPHVARVLVSAYADKDVALLAVNQGQVEKILEKPLDEELTRQALREALATGLERARQQELLDRRASALRETLGFLAHEVTSPLATVRGYLTAMRERHRDAPDGQDGVAHIEQQKPGDVLFMIEAAQRRAAYAQSLISTFVLSARDASRGDTSASLLASDLVRAVREEYPFEDGESAWLVLDVQQDFMLPGRRDLLYLVLCTLVKNAMLALRASAPARPEVRLALDRAAPAPGLPAQPVIRVSDNGPGIPPEVLRRLTLEPVTTRAASGGSGMGVLFCQRVMTSLGGTIDVRSTPGQGAAVSLYFPSTPPAPVSKEPR